MERENHCVGLVLGQKENRWSVLFAGCLLYICQCSYVTCFSFLLFVLLSFLLSLDVDRISFFHRARNFGQGQIRSCSNRGWSGGRDIALSMNSKRNKIPVPRPKTVMVDLDLTDWRKGQAIWGQAKALVRRGGISITWNWMDESWGFFFKNSVGLYNFPHFGHICYGFLYSGIFSGNEREASFLRGGIFSGIVWVATLLFLFSGSVFSVSIRSKNDFGLFFSFLFLFIVLRVAAGRRKKVLNNKLEGKNLGEIWAFELRKTFASLFFSSGQ